ncbi:LysR family transcriptional regulator [Lactonifactor longoviformis]|nr:LysR family transcriptional regulator [Lactonifactor longoviformis]
MKIEYIREFIELIQSQSFSRTAEKYYLSRSALTKHISALEEPEWQAL